jgi:AcrR family transcriptional regulator
MSSATPRTALSRERVLSGAVALADEIGIEALTIRKLAASLGVKPMTIYHHVPSKERILDGMVDVVFDEITLPPAGTDWREGIRVRCCSAREVLTRHPWAPPLMESRATPGPATLRHHDAVIACLRRGGLSLRMTAHAYAILDSFIYGFALEEANIPGGSGAATEDVVVEFAAALPADQYPGLYEFTTQYVMRPGYSFGDSFGFGLDLIIGGLDAASQDEL